MDVRYTYDMNIIVNTLVYFWRTLLLGINAIETIGLQLVQCVLDSYSPAAAAETQGNLMWRKSMKLKLWH